MQYVLDHRCLLGSGNLSPDDIEAIVVRARQLRDASRAGASAPLLKGKNLALLADDSEGDGVVRFRRAALALGARVAEVRSGLSEDSAVADLERTARTLGRLYDAVDCEGLPARLVLQVSEYAGVPVFNAIASRAHPTAELTARLGDEESSADLRDFVLQAVLLCTIN